MGGVCPKKEKEASNSSVHPKMVHGHLRDEEAEKMVNQSDSRMFMDKEDQSTVRNSTSSKRVVTEQAKPAISPQGNNSARGMTQHAKPAPALDTSKPTLANGLARPDKPNPNTRLEPMQKPSELIMDTNLNKEVLVLSQYQLGEQQADPSTQQRLTAVTKQTEAEKKAELEKINEAKKEKKNQHDDFSNRWREEMESRGLSNDKNEFDASLLKNTLHGSLGPTMKNELAVHPHPAAEQTSKTSVDSLRTNYILAVDVQAFLKHLNGLRSNPKSYSEIVRSKYLNMLDSMFYHKLTLRHYEEGKTAIDEAVKVLDSSKSRSDFSLDAGLCVAAHIQAKRQAYEMKVFGEDRASQVSENVRRFVNMPEGTPLADCNVSVQNLNYEDILINLFIGDGDLSRRNRTAIVREDFSKCGFGVFQRTKKSQIFCTLLLSGGKAQADKNKIPKDLLLDAGASSL